MCIYIYTAYVCVWTTICLHWESRHAIYTYTFLRFFWDSYEKPNLFVNDDDDDDGDDDDDDDDDDDGDGDGDGDGDDDDDDDDDVVDETFNAPGAQAVRCKM